MESIKTVLRYMDGKVLKGHTQDFNPMKPIFHFHPVDDGNAAGSITVTMEELKAVFFVKNFAGDPSFSEQKEFPEGDKSPGRKIEVAFMDGEVLQGSTLGYDPARLGFFLFPSDPGGNNIRIFVVSANVAEAKFI